MLSYDKFIDDTWNKVNSRLFNFAKIRPYPSELLGCQIYKQTIMPLFEYAGFIVDSASKQEVCCTSPVLYTYCVLYHSFHIINSFQYCYCYILTDQGRSSM